MSTELSKRACKLGVSLNCRRELHGDEGVPACDISVGGIMLTGAEMNLLMGSGAYGSLFDLTGQHPEPALPQIENIVLKGKRVGAAVTITILTTGKDQVIALEDCKLKDLTLAPMSGGLTAMALKVQTSGDHVPNTVGTLSAYLNGDITIAIGESTLEEKTSKQAELPLNTFGDDAQANA